MRRSASAFVALVASAICSVALLAPDAAAAPLHGRVLDQSRAPLPGVTVEATSPAATRVATTGRDGAYALADLPPGAYDVSFKLSGFATVVRRGVRAGGDAAPAALDVVLPLAFAADVVVTSKRTFRSLADAEDPGASLLGIADSATQGAVTAEQVASRPILRPAEVFETVPGLVISQHSGVGKANQYYLRGFNLDHGTDFATWVAGTPGNLPSHAHGQGYSDLNFLIPELVSGVQYQKGPYSVREGDFATAGSANVGYVNSLDRGLALASTGADGFRRLLVAQSPRLGGGVFLYALEAGLQDGPWVRREDARRLNAVVRWSRGDERGGGLSLTAMGYAARWSSTDQVPLRAVDSGLVPRFGAIDPTDGGRTERQSLVAEWQRTRDRTTTRLAAYVLRYRLSLFSDFTYFLDDPVHGDQFEQADHRWVFGAKGSRSVLGSLLGRDAETTLGFVLRDDAIGLDGLYRTQARARLSTVRADRVAQTSGAAYAETSLDWAPRVRVVLGLRGDAYRFAVASDDPENSGTKWKAILSPKASLVLGPWAKTQLYANAGSGFHSNDARGATIRVDPATGERADRVTPLVRALGAEVGVRSILVPRLQTTVALWGLDVASELVFAGDAGTTEPSRPSRRTGIEWSNEWRPLRGLSLDLDLALSRARFRDASPAGSHVPGSIERVLTAGVTLDRGTGPFGSLRLRTFGPRSLIEDDAVRSKGSTLLGAQAGWTFPGSRLRLALDVFNLLDARVADVDYFYRSRLPGEPAAGVADIHTHPAEPREARISATFSF